MSPERLIIFTRFPEPGKAKTRLIPALGAECAAQIHAALAKFTLETGDNLRQRRKCDVEVQFTGSSAESMQAEFGAVAAYLQQQGETLGDRLAYATERAFQEMASRVVVIGTDCLDLNSEALDTAFNALNDHDIVIGPASDGGYYLIGFRQYSPTIYQNIDWGSERVFEQTFKAAGQLGLKVKTLNVLDDIDYVEDLISHRRVGSSLEPFLPRRVPGRLSIIVPTLNEQEYLPATLESVGTPNANVEVIITDGGSTDSTVAIAKKYQCRVIKCNKGRANQLNAGAVVATGDILLFLHSDTQLPTDYRAVIDQVLTTDCKLGAFRLKIDGRGLGLRLVEWGANLRSSWLSLPYGDQALFAKAETFFQLDGFKKMPIMEDYEFCRRVAKQGRIAIANATVLTSGRRWRSRGVFKTTLINQVCVCGYHAGFSAETIAAWYRSKGNG